MTGDEDLAPPPGEHLIVCRSRAIGWYIVYDNEIVACFQSMAEMTQWLDETLGTLDTHKRAEPLPVVLADAVEVHRPSLWGAMFNGRAAR